MKHDHARIHECITQISFALCTQPDQQLTTPLPRNAHAHSPPGISRLETELSPAAFDSSCHINARADRQDARHQQASACDAPGILLLQVCNVHRDRPRMPLVTGPLIAPEYLLAIPSLLNAVADTEQCCAGDQILLQRPCDSQAVPSPFQ